MTFCKNATVPVAPAAVILVIRPFTLHCYAKQALSFHGIPGDGAGGGGGAGASTKRMQYHDLTVQPLHKIREPCFDLLGNRSPSSTATETTPCRCARRSSLPSSGDNRYVRNEAVICYIELMFHTWYLIACLDRNTECECVVLIESLKNNNHL